MAHRKECICYAAALVSHQQPAHQNITVGFMYAIAGGNFRHAIAGGNLRYAIAGGTPGQWQGDRLALTVTTPNFLLMF